MSDVYRDAILKRAEWVLANSELTGIPAASHESLRIELIKLDAEVESLQSKLEAIVKRCEEVDIETNEAQQEWLVYQIRLVLGGKS